MRTILRGEGRKRIKETKTVISDEILAPGIDHVLAHGMIMWEAGLPVPFEQRCQTAS